jgi:hypothetical protein
VLEWSLFMPLLLAAAIYAVLAIVSGVMRSRSNPEGAEKMLDIGFVVAIAAGAWTLVLLVLAIFDQPDDIWDMVLIVLVVGVFFAVLLSLLFGIFELIFSRGSGRRGAATEEAARPDPG